MTLDPMMTDTEHPAAGYLWIPDELPEIARTPEEEEAAMKAFEQELIEALQRPISTDPTVCGCLIFHADIQEEEDVD